MNERHLFHLKPITFYFFLLAAFFVGAMSDRYGWLPGISNHQPPGLKRTFDPFWEAWNVVTEYYVDRSSVQPQRMTQAAIEGMLASLGDTGHTTYLTPEDFERLENGLKGQFEGVGARISIRKRRPTIVQAIPGSPAAAAGLKAGDALLEVNDKNVSDLPLDQIVNLVRGPAGTSVHLRVSREGVAKPIDFEITRARVDVPDISWHLLPGSLIVHLAIQNFGTQADEQLRTAIAEGRQKGARAWIIDVRGNPGGLKEQAVAITSEFLKDGNVFIEQDARGRRKEVPVQPGGVATEIPICIITDEGTASSAEIFAGAIQDHDRGKIVGMKTFGTGTVLRPFHLSDGSAVLLAVAEWFTPKGRQIWHKGIAPDIEVALPSGANVLFPDAEGNLDTAALGQSDDKQVLKAFEILRQKIGEGKQPKTKAEPAK